MEQHAGQTILDDRYGRRRRLSTRAWWIIGLAAVLAVSVGIALFTFTRTYTNISYNSIGFRAQSSSRATITGQVSTTAGAPARCSIEIFDKNFDITGWKYIDLPASATPTRHISVSVRTVLPPVGGDINTCWLVSQ